MAKKILPVIIGPTATQKTRLAALVAYELQAEIISADSRQVYREMDVGTGKDLIDYVVNNKQIPYHLINICNPGDVYNVFQFQSDFIQVYKELEAKNSMPIVCGGSGMYVEAIVKNYNMHVVPENTEFRNRCELLSFDDLIQELRSLKALHNTTDIDSKKRLIRALEIAYYEKENPNTVRETSIEYEPVVIGVDISRETRRNRIEMRFKKRLNEGMVSEVENLIAQGVSPDILKFYGLEYKYITMYILGEISKQEFETKLLQSIFQFSKRQMTWFRGMERRGIQIHWINGEADMDSRVSETLQIISKYKSF